METFIISLHSPAIINLCVYVVVIVLIRRLQDYRVLLSCSVEAEKHSTFGDMKGAKSSACKAV